MDETESSKEDDQDGADGYVSSLAEPKLAVSNLRSSASSAGATIRARDVKTVETYFPGNLQTLTSRSRTSISYNGKDRFSVLSIPSNDISSISEPSQQIHADAVPPLLVVFVCLIAAFLGFAVAGLHSMIKYVGCPLGINGCNSFYGEEFQRKGYIIPRALSGYVPEDLIYIVMAIVCSFAIGLIVDLVPENYGKQVLGGGTVQSLLAVAAGIPIPFRCAVLRVIITALYFVGGGTMGGDGPTIQVCTSLSCMIGWVCGIRAPRTQSLLASLGFCCGFASSFNAPLSGILFAMEELQHVSSRLTTRVLCIILIGSVVSTSVMRGFLGNKVLFEASHPHDLEVMVSGASWERIYGQSMWMLIAIPIGFLSSFAGYCFSKAFHYIHRFISKVALKRAPKSIVFSIVGGLVACIGSAVFRMAGLRGVWGIGFRSLQEAFNEDFSANGGELLIFAFGKLAAFALSVSCRFPGDTLEPVLISGAFLGAAIGRMLPKEVVGDSDSACEIFGMVGLFASCFRFPLTPVVFAIELTWTRTYNLVLPVAVSCFTGLQLSNYLFEPILEQILHQDNIDLEAVAELAEMAEQEEMRRAEMGLDEVEEEDTPASGDDEPSSPRSLPSKQSKQSKHSKDAHRKTTFQTLIGKLEESMLDISSPQRLHDLPMRADSNRSIGRGRRSSQYSEWSQKSSERHHASGRRSSRRSRQSRSSNGTQGTMGTVPSNSSKEREESKERSSDQMDESIEGAFDGQTERI